ncbi:MAG: 30S ribosomal protein S17 [Candidatus Margulisiibacteriota bacterium]
MKRNIRRTTEGCVLRKSSDKTIVVTVARVFQHPQYKKVIRTFKNYLVHDAEGKAQAGDLVLIRTTRPLSARKRHILVEVLGKGKVSQRELPAKREKEAKSDTGKDQPTSS